MARFYADEQFPFPVMELLRALGHDVLKVLFARTIVIGNSLQHG
ncbi:DUF5615 family PIN-like protein [Nostoc sp.]